MEAIEVDEIPANEEPAQVPDQIFVQEQGTRVSEPEMQESQANQLEPARSGFDIANLSFELQQGYRIYTELLADSNRNVTWPFLEPVDVDSLGLWDYNDRIKQPMCFSKIGSKFVENKYTSITEVVADVRLILENCYRYNGPSHWVSKLGQKLEKILEQKLALLNRSLRDKVTLTATLTMTKGIPLNELEVTGRRRSSRQNYLSMVNGENSSSLVNHLKIIEDAEEKERRRQREKEKKEANQALLQDLVEWEKKELTLETINQLHSMWEIPSTGSLLYMVRDILGIEDINLTEFELSFVYPNKSSLLAKIFTALLITPHQRKSIYKRPAMKFKMWESKLKEKLDTWYKVREREGEYMAVLLFGIEPKFFELLGAEHNPLEQRSYLDLTLHQRVWILKALSDVCFHKDYDIRDKVNACDMMEQRELFLGCDSNNHCYIYFPIFQTTDLRVYRHDPLEVPSFKPEKEPSPPPSPPPPPPPEKKRVKKTPARSFTPRSARLRQLRSNAEKVEDIEEDERLSKEDNQEKEEDKKTKQNKELKDGRSPLNEGSQSMEDNQSNEKEQPKEGKWSTNNKKSENGDQKDKKCDIDEQSMEGMPNENKQTSEGSLSQDSKEHSTEKEENMSDKKDPLVEDKDPNGISSDIKQQEPKPPLPPLPIFKSEDGFHLACYDIETLKALSEQFSKPPTPPPPPPKKRGRRSLQQPTPRKRCVVDLYETLLALLQELEKYEGAFSRNYTKAKIKIMKESLEPEPMDEPEPEPEPEATADEWGSEISDDDAGAKNDAKDEDFRIEDEYDTSKSNKKDDMEQGITDSDEGSSAGTQTNVFNKRKRKLQNEEEASANCTISIQTPPLKLKKKPKKWSPTKEKFFPTTIASTSSSSSVVISAVSAEESLKATAAKTFSTSGPPTNVSPDKILVNALEHALKKAKAHASKSNEKIASNISVTTPILPGNTASPRKRVLVSPEGKTHEIKPTFHVASSEAQLPSTTLPSHPPIQRKSDLLNAINNKGGTTKLTIGSYGIKTTPQVQTTPKIHPSTHQRPNILSRTKTHPIGNLKAGLPGQTVASSNKPHGVVIPGSNVSGNGNIVQVMTNVATSIPSTSSGKGVAPKTNTPGQTSMNITLKAGTLKTSAITKTATIGQTAKGAQAATSQTKIIVIPAASVDAKSPLASFKPQSITTANGQSIYGYAVVVPPGSAQEVNAVINSSLKKTLQTTVKQGGSTVQGKPAITASQGKPNIAVTTGKPISAVTQGKPTVVVAQGKPTVVVTQGKSTVQMLPAKPTTAVTQGKPTVVVAQGKATLVATQGKPTVAMTQGQTLVSHPQTKLTVAMSQGKPTVAVQPGKSTAVVSQGKPTAAAQQGKLTTVTLQANQNTNLQTKSPLTIVTGKPGSVVLPAKHLVQSGATTAYLKGIPAASLQGKSSISILQANAQGKPTTFVLQGNPTTSVVQGNQGNTGIQGKPTIATVLQGKPTSTVIQGGKPTVNLILGNQGSSAPQGKTLTASQAKTTIGAQGKPTIAILQGNPNSGTPHQGSKTVISTTNVAAFLSSLGQLKTVVTTTAHSQNQFSTVTNVANLIKAQLNCSETTQVTSSPIVVSSAQSILHETHARTMKTPMTCTAQCATQTQATVTSTSSTFVQSNSSVQAVTIASTSANNESGVDRSPVVVKSCSSSQASITNTINTDTPCQSAKVTLLQQAKDRIAAGGNDTQTVAQAGHSTGLVSTTRHSPVSSPITSTTSKLHSETPCNTTQSGFTALGGSNTGPMDCKNTILTTIVNKVPQKTQSGVISLETNVTTNQSHSDSDRTCTSGRDYERDAVNANQAVDGSSQKDNETISSSSALKIQFSSKITTTREESHTKDTCDKNVESPLQDKPCSSGIVCSNSKTLVYCNGVSVNSPDDNDLDTQQSTSSLISQPVDALNSVPSKSSTICASEDVLTSNNSSLLLKNTSQKTPSVVVNVSDTMSISSSAVSKDVICTSIDSKATSTTAVTVNGIHCAHNCEDKETAMNNVAKSTTVTSA